MTWVFICLLLALGVVAVAERRRLQAKIRLADQNFIAFKQRIKKRNVAAVELQLATTGQIFQELSKRGKVILLIPHKQNDVSFVETLAAQLSPSQTMQVLRVAYTGIADHLGATDSDEEESG